MRVYNESFSLSTKGEIDFIDLTGKVVDVAKRSGVRNGLIHVFTPHATGIIGITEFTQDLLNDIKETIGRLLPRDGTYEHPWNAHSHIRSLFLGSSKTIPVIEGKPFLGTWQSIFFIETDVAPRRRTVVVQVIGE